MDGSRREAASVLAAFEADVDGDGVGAERGLGIDHNWYLERSGGQVSVGLHLEVRVVAAVRQRADDETVQTEGLPVGNRDVRLQVSPPPIRDQKGTPKCERPAPPLALCQFGASSIRKRTLSVSLDSSKADGTILGCANLFKSQQ